MKSTISLLLLLQLLQNGFANIAWAERKLASGLQVIDELRAFLTFPTASGFNLSSLDMTWQAFAECHA